MSKTLTATANNTYGYPVTNHPYLAIHGEIDEGSFKSMEGRRIVLAVINIPRLIKVAANGLRKLEGNVPPYEQTVKEHAAIAARLRELADEIEQGNVV